jgi:hypothetical protein
MLLCSPSYMNMGFEMKLGFGIQHDDNKFNKYYKGLIMQHYNYPDSRRSTRKNADGKEG